MGPVKSGRDQELFPFLKSEMTDMNSHTNFFINKRVLGQRALSVLLLVFLFFSSSFAADKEAIGQRLVGVYILKGATPMSTSTYSGNVVIQKAGDTYKLIWNVGGIGYIGTGILTDDVLSVIYSDSGSKGYGIAAYKISDKGDSLTGQWTTYNGEQLGTEVMTKTKGENVKSVSPEKPGAFEL